MIEIEAVTDYLLSLSDPEVGDGISNLKLQKLLYYSQGFSLAINNRPLFRDAIEAWEHGPVVPNVYYKYKDYGSNNIPIPEGTDLSLVASNNDIKEVIDEVYNVYGQFSAWKLRDMTHKEPPWNETPKGNVISLDKLRSYFSTMISLEN